MSAHADDYPPLPSMAELREQMAKTQAEFEERVLRLRERLEKRPCGCYRWDEDCPYYEREN